ncbi:putative glycosidase CRH2 [Thecaphora frezii]
MMRSPLLPLLTLLCLLFTTASSQSCSSTSRCGASAPCCSEFAYCGTTSAHCLGGCDPSASFSPSSCRPMPKCVSQTIDFTGSARPFVSLSTFNGDPTQAAMTLDSGVAVAGKTGVSLRLTRTGDAVAGTRLSTTRYWYYGKASVTMRHQPADGVVATFISMANGKDEIDWEFTTSDAKDAQTNYYWHGQPDYTHGYTVPPTVLPSTFNASAFHTYTLSWSPNRLQWSIDGVTVRTVYRKNTLDATTGIYHYPATPARLQVSIWGAGTDAFPQGTRDWAGGYIDWNQANQNTKAFSAVVKNIKIECADPQEVAKGTAYAFSQKTKDPATGQPKVLGTAKSTLL